MEAGRQLADELRGIIELASTVDHNEAAVRRAAELVAEARGLLDGPAATRWYELDDPDPASITRAYSRLSPFRGTENPLAPPLHLEQGDGATGPHVVGTVRLGRAYEGPPHGVHGGIVAGLFDDVLGAAQRLSGTRGVTGRLTVRYRSLTPLDTDLVFRGEVAEQSGRRVTCTATCHAGETRTAEAEALFVAVDFDRLAEGSP